ncbi:MAG: TIGR03560 family F420-dependent LLM class oxidoreductase [Actinomycetota bacterium]
MRVCLMVEGQEGVSWDQWVALALAAEEAGLEALFRSDHYLSFSHPRERVVLDAWASIAGLAAVTRRIKLGTMVSPATFRHPSNLAKSVATADHISGGRVELGLGAGWNEAEHRAYGFPFPPTKVRLEMFAEQAEIVHRSWNDRAFSFSGKHYTIEDLDALPKPAHAPHPNFIVGGQAGPKSVAVAARWADEYNTNFANAETCTRRRARAVEAWEKAGRHEPPVFSLMTGSVVGRDEGDMLQRAERIMAHAGQSGEPRAFLDALPDVMIIGTLTRAADRLKALGDAGVDRVMLQMQDHSDVEMVHVLGEVAALVG